MAYPINVIDLFAGPGGLGEGFAGYRDAKGRYPFKVVVSAEKDPSAHGTLSLRALQREVNRHPSVQRLTALSALKENLTQTGSINVGKIATDSGLEKLWAKVSSEALNLQLGVHEDDELLASALKRALLRSHPLVLIGGPPCQAYSVVGRVRNRAKSGYKPESDERHFLYREYLKIVAAYRPEVFVMENVRGILSSKICGKPIFPRIIEDLSNPGRALGVKNGGVRYRLLPLAAERTDLDSFGGATAPEDFIVKAERHGVPQARHRVIVVGIREDLRLPRDFSMTLDVGQNEIPASTVLMGLPPIRSGVSGHKDAASGWIQIVEDARKNLVRILKFRDPTISSYLSTLEFNPSLKRSESLYHDVDEPEIVLRWYRSDSRLNQLFNHETRSHMRQDLSRYLYCAAFSIVHRRSPTSSEFPSVLAPNHQNWATGDFADRFRVQLPFRPASTVTSHLAKDGHHFIHWDASQCRSMSVREAARLQTFPDDYVFLGGRTSQFTQVGNAVPPLLARQIAEKIASFFRA
jgi:DNA (cytosine-5)-methyltransferase 1